MHTLASLYSETAACRVASAIFCTTGVMTIPLSVAFASMAGLPAAFGLYTCLAPSIAFGLFGGSRHLVRTFFFSTPVIFVSEDLAKQFDFPSNTSSGCVHGVLHGLKFLSLPVAGYPSQV